MPKYTFTIDARPAELGDGWQLRLFEDDKEVGGGVFPFEDDTEEAKQLAYLEAEEEGENWLASR